MSRRVRLAAIGALLTACTLPALSTARGASDNGVKANISYSTWLVSGDEVMLRFLLPVREAEPLVGRAPAVVTTARLGKYLLEHTAVTAAGRDCPAADQGYDIGRVDPLAVGAGLYGFEILFRCGSSSGVTLEDSVGFDRLPGHFNVARIEVRGQSFQELFSASRQRVALPDAGAITSAGPSAYFPLGARHALQRLDLWCFLLGSLVLLRRGRELVWLVTALIGGYGLSIATALYGGITLRMSLANASIGFWVAFLAARQITRGLNRPSAGAAGTALLLLTLAAVAVILRSADEALLLAGTAILASGLLLLSSRTSDHVLVTSLPAFMVALFDGGTLPAALTPVGLPARVRLPMLAGFNMGALVAAMALLLVPAALYLVLKGRRDLLRSALFTDLASMILGGLGIFWLVARVYA
jgi:hypothetical protein